MPVRRLVFAAVTIAALVPPLRIAWLVATHARNMPYWDQWGFAPFALEAATGRFPPSLMWAQVNEHRVPVAFALQGAVAWGTRWDLRGDAWTNVAIGLMTLAALAGLVRRTIAPHAPAGAVAVVLASSTLVFWPGHGISWTAGWITPAYLATAAAAVFAWLAARWGGTARGFAALATSAVAGALSFGAGIVLLVLLPLVPLVSGAPWSRQLGAATAGALVAATVLFAYFHGWHHRVGYPPAVLRPEWALEYLRYTLAYVGSGAVGRGDLASAVRWGIGMSAFAVGAGGWLARRRPDLRPLLVPWTVLLVYGFGNGLVTAFGRLANGMHTAVLERYLPTAGLFVVGVVAVAALFATDIVGRSRVWGALVVVVLAGVAMLATPAHLRTGRAGIERMRDTAQKLDAGRSCMTACATTTDGCFARITFNVQFTRQVCLLIEAARIGPFQG